MFMRLPQRHSRAHGDHAAGHGSSALAAACEIVRETPGKSRRASLIWWFATWSHGTQVRPWVSCIGCICARVRTWHSAALHAGGAGLQSEGHGCFGCGGVCWVEALGVQGRSTQALTRKNLRQGAWLPQLVPEQQSWHLHRLAFQHLRASSLRPSPDRGVSSKSALNDRRCFVHLAADLAGGMTCRMT